MDIFRRIFGLHHNDDQRSQFWRGPETNEDIGRPDNIFPDDPFNRRSFDVFSDPIQMHQYFESQLNEVLKMFGFHGNADFSIGFPDAPVDNWSQTPHQFQNENSQNVRDQFLKPGYEKPKSQYSEMVDKDLDDKIKSGDISSVLGEKFNSQVTPYEPPKQKNFFYGSSQSLRTIRNADGSIETHRTMRDNDGNEETTVCHQIGDKQYCVIKKKNKQGQEEVTENYMNMTEKEKDIFTKPRNSPQIQDRTGPADFPWSKFF